MSTAETSSKRKIAVKKEILPKKKARLEKRAPPPDVESDGEQANNSEDAEVNAHCAEEDDYEDDCTSSPRIRTPSSTGVSVFW